MSLVEGGMVFRYGNYLKQEEAQAFRIQLLVVKQCIVIDKYSTGIMDLLNIWIFDDAPSHTACHLVVRASPSIVILIPG